MKSIADSVIAHAQFFAPSPLARDLLTSVVVPGRLPTEIQWLPPGPQRMVPLIGGIQQRLTVTPDKGLADELNAELQRQRAAAASGQGELPTVDLTEAPSDATAEVLSLEWRGDDPNSGGIWAVLRWLPQDETKSQPTDSGAILEASAKAYAEEKGCRITEAYTAFAKSNRLYSDYRARILGLPQARTASAKSLDTILGRVVSGGRFSGGMVMARAKSSLTELDSLPTDIQWMPPGRQTVRPACCEAPFTFDVTPEVAAIAQADLQAMLADAAAGRDVEPYGDFNHKDDERVFKPKRFYWGGPDPKKGGVRLVLEWLGVGAKAIRDGAQACISPSWGIKKEIAEATETKFWPLSKAFLGIRHNVGGLVPRSAFHAIQAFAKGDITFTARGEFGLVAQAKAFATGKKCTITAAYNALAKDNAAYERYRCELLGLPLPPARETQVIVSGKEPFLGQVRALEYQGHKFSAAVSACAKKFPLLYEGYRAEMRGVPAGTQVAAR